MNVWKEDDQKMGSNDLRLVVKLIAPIAPFMSEEIWQSMNQKSDVGGGNTSFESVHLEKYPVFNPQRIISTGVLVIIQVNGKKRAEMTIDHEEVENKEEVIRKSKELEGMEKWIGSRIKNEVFVVRNDQVLVNFVV